jgi:hypothetical protein
MVFVVNTSNIYYYLDNTQVYTSSLTGGYSLPNQTYTYNVIGNETTHIGTVGGSGGNYNIANFRVYNKVLSTNEISNLYITKT